MGFLKHALVLTFYFLYLVELGILKDDDSLYYYAMRQSSMLGGDTDTNCAIVGGVIGALVGVENIDNHYLVTSLECDINQGEQPDRPDWLQQSKGCIDDIIRLYELAPTSLTVLNHPWEK